MIFLEPLKKHISAFQKTLETSKEISFEMLEGFHARITEEIERASKTFDTQKELIRSAIEQKAKFLPFRESVLKTLFPLKLRMLLSAPFIYGMIFPALFLDIFLEVYHQVCFRLYGIPRVKRGEHFLFDRRHLSYLNGIEKAHCCYCSYFNGLMSYAKEIAGRTERYFCPIKNAHRRKDPHQEYSHFIEYLEGGDYRKKRGELRKFEEKSESPNKGS